VICDGTQKSQDLVVQKNGKVTEISAQVLIIRPCPSSSHGAATQSAAQEMSMETD
jgi:hypothetical protein